MVLWCIWLAVISDTQMLYAQLAEKLFVTDSRIDSLSRGLLSVEVDNLSFFMNNEYGSTLQKGYTLPGFWLQLKACFYPLSKIKLEAGVHSIWFWGTTLYPAFAYKGISTWNGRDYAHNVHVLPYFRAHVALSDNLSLILGDIYGGSNHRLIEPLYNPELNLASDPEAGMQLLYNNKWLQLDLWIDWMTYIYNLDTHQEAFVAGAAARFDITPPESRFHVYLPLQGLALHRGGEIDVTDENIQTIMNGAFGAALKWNMEKTVVKSIHTEFDVTGYHFPKGRTFQPLSGKGYYAKAAVQLKDFNISTSYWSCHDFTPFLGNPFYGSVSTKKKEMLYENPEMLYLGVDYVRSLGKGFSLGIKADAYHYISGKMYSSETGLYQTPTFGKSLFYSFGVCLRINPTFPIRKF